MLVLALLKKFKSCITGLEEDDEDADDKEPEEEPQDDGHVPYDEETQKLVDAATEARNQYSGKSFR